MLARGSGWVVNVNTPISHFAWPGAIGYGGSRWAMRGFDACLHADLRGTGVGVTQVVPGKVSSEYFEHNPGAEERIPSIARLIRTLSPDDVAEGICQGIERERREVIQPLMLRLLFLQARLAPRLTEWVVWRTGARRNGV
jgi:short-subunit dehydrogenase